MKQKNNKFVEYMNELFTDAECELKFGSEFELLVSVILSAQCTDKRVNMVTKELYKKYNTPKDFANMPQEKLEELIHPCGFYHNKAKNIISASKDILERFDGKVPSNMKDLMSLAGVGQKTANVVMAVAFKGDNFAVDTHVFRVSHRLGFAKSATPEKTEEELKKAFDKNLWSRLHHQMVLFGRYYCKAIKPECEGCKLKDMCEYYKRKR